MPRKSDIKLVDRIVKELNLSKQQRRLLHDEMRRKEFGEDLELGKIRELAQEVLELYPHK